MNTAVLLLSACLAAEPPAVAKAEPAPELDKLVRRTDGWVGGDGAFTVATSDKRTLWLFSDTWVGHVRDGKRKDVAMVNNTIGVQDGHGADAKITFAIAKGKDGKPGTLFVPPDGKGWFWLFAGHHADGKLHVFLPRQEKTKDPGAFGFRGVDVWLGTVSNPSDEPAAWRIAYAKVPFADLAAETKRSFGSAVLTAGEHAYIYGYEEKPGKPFSSRKLLVARCPVAKLADFDSWRFLGADNEWKADAKDAVSSAENIGTEFSVSYLPGLKQYALVYTELGLSDRIVGRFASSPAGPWSEPVLLFQCPEMKQQKGVFTYAAKAHPHFATNGNELVISYVVNAFQLAPVINDAELYWPRFVRVSLK
ncbi:MAG: DUF4185 domain-containing protein [Gemmataceae bacterium]